MLLMVRKCFEFVWKEDVILVIFFKCHHHVYLVRWQIFVIFYSAWNLHGNKSFITCFLSSLLKRFWWNQFKYSTISWLVNKFQRFFFVARYAIKRYFQFRCSSKIQFSFKKTKKTFPKRHWKWCNLLDLI